MATKTKKPVAKSKAKAAKPAPKKVAAKAPEKKVELKLVSKPVDVQAPAAASAAKPKSYGEIVAEKLAAASAPKKSEVAHDAGAAKRAASLDLGGPEPTLAPEKVQAKATETLTPVKAPAAVVVAAPAPVLGRNGVDWRAAGIKAAATRQARAAAALGLTVDDLKARRIAKDKEMLLREGFADQKEFFALGTNLAESGEKKWQESRGKHNAMPLLHDGLDKLIAAVTAEDRADYDLLVPETSMLDDGSLNLGKPIGTFPIEEDGFASLVRRTIPGGGSELLAVSPPVVRAYNYNHWKGSDRNTGAALKFRTRMVRDPKKSEAERRVFGVVSTSYSTFDVDELARIVREKVDKTAKVSIAYDGFKARIDCHFHSPISAKEAGVGETFHVGTYFETCDDGTGSISGGAFAERIRCVNMTRLSQKLSTGRQIHMGRTDAIRLRVNEIVTDAMKKVQGFADMWAEADRDNILDSNQDPLAQFKLLLERGYVDTRAGCTKDAMASRFLAAWQKEPARYTRTAVVNAITRAAHENPWSNPWAAQELEEAAGRLLHVRVNLQPW